MKCARLTPDKQIGDASHHRFVLEYLDCISFQVQQTDAFGIQFIFGDIENKVR